MKLTKPLTPTFNMEEQVKITILADPGFVADALRELATIIEEREEDNYDLHVENSHYDATVEEIF